METKKVISNDKATVIIQMSPQAKDSVIYVDGQETLKHTAVFKGFFKTQPKALGIVQIMIGVMVFLIGVLLTIDVYRFNIPHIVVSTGITYWGSFIYIIAGSLSVAAQNKVSPCLVKASLGINVFSAITAGVAIIVMIAYMFSISMHPQWIAEQKSLRHVGIMLLFTLPQFIISICISALACKATCNIHPTVVNVALNQGYQVMVRRS